MTGSVASMGLALAVGRGDSPLARLAGQEPLVLGQDVALVGRRDQGQSYGHEALAVSGILDLPWATIAPDGQAFLPNAADAETSTIVLAGWRGATWTGSGSSSTPTCSTRRSCPRSGRPSQAVRRHRRARALLAPAGQPPEGPRHGAHAVRPLARPRPVVRGRLVELLGAVTRRRRTTCRAGLTSSARRAAPARTHRARSRRRRRCAPPGCWLSSRSAASPSTIAATCPASAGGSIGRTCGP